ncbi:hypothetical protein KAR91_17910 [Candidatus Pacearchaeota archaeon]|nr:hypothetical protein [Candidatus Pacearchaeota archaeon]
MLIRNMNKLDNGDPDFIEVTGKVTSNEDWWKEQIGTGGITTSPNITISPYWKPSISISREEYDRLRDIEQKFLELKRILQGVISDTPYEGNTW